MALTQEEIRIRAGLDYSRVTAGLTSIRNQVNNLANDVPKKLSNLLKANVYVAAASMISEVLPTWDEIWNRVYGVDEQAIERLKQNGENLKKLRDQLKSSEAARDKATRSAEFTRGDTSKKHDILEGEYEAARKNTEQAKEALKFAKDHNESLERRKQLEVELNNALTKQFEAETALFEFQKGLSPAELEKQFKRKLDAANSAVYANRKEIAARDANAKDFPMTPEEQAERDRLAGGIQSATVARGVERVGQISEAIPNFWMFGDLKKAMEDAYISGMKSTIQKVRIVDDE